jgi:hypothetical protein
VSTRRLFLDRSPGEARGVVLLDGRPEQLFIEREGDAPGARLGERHRARVEELSPGLRLARLVLAGGLEAALPLPKSDPPARGAAVEVEIAAEARGGKLAVARLIGPASGPPERLGPAPSLEARLKAAAPGAGIMEGEGAREAADLAEEAALTSSHALAGGVQLHIEPTRALVAVDVDWSGTPRPSAAAVMRANLEAIQETARLLRLKALGGGVAIDLVGFPRDRDALQAAARDAFAADGPGVSVLPANRLGLLCLSKPHRERPLADILCGPDGRLSARTIAQRLVRALERQGRADPGARLVADCASDVAAELEPLAALLGPRFSVAAQLGWDRSKTDIRSR